MNIIVNKKGKKVMKKIVLALLLVTALVLTVVGCMAEKTYTVTFDTDGGSAWRL